MFGRCHGGFCRIKPPARGVFATDQWTLHREKDDTFRNGLMKITGKWNEELLKKKKWRIIMTFFPKQEV